MAFGQLIFRGYNDILLILISLPVQSGFMQELLSYHWEKYVGRRQPPLRGELAFRGVLKWFKDYDFNEDFSKLYIYFSKLSPDKGIISDHYIFKRYTKVSLLCPT